MADDRSVSIRVSAICLMSLGVIAVVTRLAVRFRLDKVGGDDYLITLSCCFLMACCIVSIVAAGGAFGRHAWDVTPAQLSAFLRNIAAVSATYSCGIALAKASFAVLYIRLQPVPWLVLANKLLIVFVTCQAIEEVCIVIFRCNPISKGFEAGPLPLEGCLDLKVLWWTTFVFNMCTDLFLFIQPIPVMWRLQLPLARRIGLICMLSLGLFVCVISIIRITYVTRVGSDSSWELADPLIWSQAELCALILCSCIPSLRQLAQMIPCLSRALGLASKRSSDPSRTKSAPYDAPIALKNGRNYSRPRPKSFRFSRSHFGTSSKVTVGDSIKDNNSTENIVPPPPVEGSGAIRVTTEVMRAVEPNIDGTPPSTAESMATARYFGDMCHNSQV